MVFEESLLRRLLGPKKNTEKEEMDIRTMINKTIGPIDEAIVNVMYASEDD